MPEPNNITYSDKAAIRVYFGCSYFGLRTQNAPKTITLRFVLWALISKEAGSWRINFGCILRGSSAIACDSLGAVVEALLLHVADS